MPARRWQVGDRVAVDFEGFPTYNHFWIGLRIDKAQVPASVQEVEWRGGILWYLVRVFEADIREFEEWVPEGRISLPGARW